MAKLKNFIREKSNQILKMFKAAIVKMCFSFS